MRQIILERPGAFKERDVPVPQPREGEALVRVRCVGLCGSDYHAYAGRHPAYAYPRVLGHELGCEVVEAPANEYGIRAGDRCAIDAFLTCKQCVACRRDRGNCCDALQYLGIHLDGGMQPFFAVPLRLLSKSDSLTFDQLALVEPLGVGLNAVLRSKVEPGESVLVIGAGPIGLGAAQFAQAFAGKVRVIEIQQARRKFVESLGIEALAAPDDQLADVVIDATGSAGSMAASFNYVGSGGRLVFLSLVQGRIAFDDWLFHKREITLLASRTSWKQFPRIIRMLEENQIDTSAWVTHRLGLQEVPRDFESLQSQPGMVKAMVEITDDDL